MQSWEKKHTIVVQRLREDISVHWCLNPQIEQWTTRGEKKERKE